MPKVVPVVGYFWQFEVGDTSALHNPGLGLWHKKDLH